MATYFWHQDVYDGSLNEIKNNADRVTLCEGAPTTYAQATGVKGGDSGKMLAQADVVPGDFTLASDGAGGRKFTLADMTDDEADASGDADHVAFVDDAEGVERLLCVVPLSAQQAVTLGNPCIIKNVICYNRILSAVA